MRFRMSLTIRRKLFLFISVVSILLQTYSTDDVSPRLNITNEASYSYIPQANEAIPRGSLAAWRNLKFPARPSRPRTWTWNRNITTTTESAIPSTTKRTTTTTATTSSESFRSKQDILRRMDVIDSSSSEHHPRSVVWPLRLRSGQAKRFRVPTPTTPAPQVLLKLLQPKPTRPAIYSLDGFVPKPSIKRIISTTEPPYSSFNGKTDLQQLSSTIRRRKVNRFSKHDDEEDYNENEAAVPRRKKPVSRYTAFARKGIPGQDYPVFGFIPQTDFQCGDHSGAGLYADQYTNCQVWHMCPGGNMAPRHSFLCPNGTIFNQKKRICDWWYNVDCKRHFRNKRAFNFIDDEDMIEFLYPDIMDV